MNSVDKDNVIGMTGKALVIAACFLMFGGVQAQAKEQQTHTWELGSEISTILYQEDVMSEDGVMYGVEGSYTYRGAVTESFESAMLKVDTHLNWGEVDYDGKLSTGAPYLIDGINDFMWEIRGVGGYDFDVLNDVTLTPYFGFGYRYLNDDLAKDPAGYERESNYYYSPAGFELAQPLGNGWSIGGTAEYDIFWSGVQKSHLSDAVAAVGDIENDQHDGYGVRGSVRLAKKTKSVDWLIEPFVRYWKIEESDPATFTLSGTIIGTAVEPKNKSTEYGVKIAARF